MVSADSGLIPAYLQPPYHAFERVEGETKVDRIADFSLALDAHLMLVLSSQHQYPPPIHTGLVLVYVGDPRRAYRRFPAK